MYCSACGNKIVDNAQFCPFCGAKVIKAIPVEERIDIEFEPEAEVEIDTEAAPVSESVAEPVMASVTEPIAIPVSETVAEPVAEPVMASVTEPIAIPVSEIATQPTIEPEPVEQTDIVGDASVLLEANVVEEIPEEPIEAPLVSVDSENVESNTSEPKKSKKKALIIVIIIAVIAAICGGVAIGIHIHKQNQYESAVSLLDEGKYTEAGAIFSELGDYEESKSYCDICDAMAAMDKGDYESALAILEGIETSNVEGSSSLITECKNNIAYEVAMDSYNDGLYFTAREAFLDLGDFKDSADMANKCICKKPGNGEVYRNSDYKSSAVSITINAPESGSDAAFLKFYTSGGTHVCSVFINAGSKTTIKLPAGTYSINAATSSGDWFGQKEMFGDKGFYTKLTDSTTSGGNFNLKSNYSYELSLQTSKSDGDSVNSSSIDRGSF